MMKAVLEILCFGILTCALITAAEDLNPNSQKPSATKQEIACQNLSDMAADTPALSILRSICSAVLKWKGINDKKTRTDKELRIFVTQQRALLVLNSTSLEYRTIAKVDVHDTIVAVEYDPVDGFVYYSILGRSVYRKKKDGTERERIINGTYAVGLAVDWIARNLYWADEDLKQIHVSRLDGSSQKTLIRNGIDRPRGIAVDPLRGKLYWTDWGTDPRIAKASLDGSNVETLVGDDLKWPNGIALDLERKLVYFGDAKTDKIEVIGMNGSGRRTVLDRNVMHVFAMSFLDNHLYWVDWQTRSMERINTDGMQNRTILFSAETSQLMGVKATYLTPIEGTNDCAQNNGGCSHLCFFNGKDVTCGCPDDITGSPGREA